MQCPYCNCEMTNGSLIGNQSKIKFVPGYKEIEENMWAKRCPNCRHCLLNCDKVFEDMISKKSIPLGNSPKIGRPQVPNVYHCDSCKTFIIEAPPL